MEQSTAPRRFQVANNFHIGVRTKGSSLHLILSGDFDGSSAFELINLLKAKKHEFTRMVIHTDGLRKIFPFGTEIFKTRSGFEHDDSVSVEFKGDCARELELEAPGSGVGI
jgi:hypothetical protein